MTEEKKGKGSCHCEGVQYSFTFPVNTPSICHCNMCRSLHGSDYTTWITLKEDSFSIEKGAELITEYKASENTLSHFCSRCGTKIYSKDKRYQNTIGLLSGTLRVKIEEFPQRQWFWDKKVPWLGSLQKAKKFAGENAEPVDEPPTHRD